MNNINKVEWKSYPTVKPENSGYYYTYYYNINQSRHLYKCIYWDSTNEEWIFPHYDFRVKTFLPESHSNYYSECLEKLHHMTYDKVGHEFYVIMVKRQDGEVYADLAKTTQHIYLLKEDAEKDLENFPHHHIVKMIGYIDYDK